MELVPAVAALRNVALDGEGNVRNQWLRSPLKK